MTTPTSPPTSKDPITTAGDRQTVKTRLLIMSDTHTALPKPPSSTNYAYRHPLPEADVLLHCGDLTHEGRAEEYADTLTMLASHAAELKLVIAGNHDITLDRDYYGSALANENHHSSEDVEAIREMWCGDAARRHGIRYLDEGIHTFSLTNGAHFTVYASPYQPTYQNWAFAYARSDAEDRFNPSPAAPLPEQPTDHPNPTKIPIPAFPAVDLILTHGPPQGILDAVYQPHGDNNVGCAHLLRAVQRSRPSLHCFGHIHEGWGAVKMDWGSGELEVLERDARAGEVVRERCARIEVGAEGWGRETVFVNAAVMDVGYRPVNAPWVVEVELPWKGGRGEGRGVSC